MKEKLEAHSPQIHNKKTMKLFQNEKVNEALVHTMGEENVFIRYNNSRKGINAFEKVKRMQNQAFTPLGGCRNGKLDMQFVN